MSRTPSAFETTSVHSENEQTETLEVEIERILPGGLGLAHGRGLTVFVALSAPGDLLRVKVDRTRGKVAFASIVEVIKPSAHRVAPPCPYFGRCGGCDFQQLTYEAQLAAKTEIIADCFHRIGKIDLPRPLRIIPSANTWQYRARTSWQVDLNQSLLGYFEGQSHRVCDVEVCAVLVPDLQTALAKCRAALRAGSLKPANEINAVAGANRVSLSLPTAGYDNDEVSRTIAGFNYSYNADSFFQINHSLLEALVQETIDDAHGDLAVDLYCGVGLFTLPLAHRFASVVGVEANVSAANFARQNLARAQLNNARIANLNVTHWLDKEARRVGDVDLLLLDPPRTGVEPSALEGILALGPQRLIYVSCDPATLARDMRRLTNSAYTIESLVAFDLFPQTHHVETVVKLNRVS